MNLITLLAVLLFWLISTSWHPWSVFNRAGFSADFYDEQARALLRGRLAVDPSVPGPEGFLINGRTYLYYGPFLAVVRLPFALFGHVFSARLVRVSMLIAVVVLCRWAARLARAGARVVGRAEAPWPVGLFVAAVVFSPALFAAGWISVYNETELWAFTLALIGATLLLEWAAGGFVESRLLLWATAAALAATLTRAPIGLGVALAIGICGVVLAWRSRADHFRAGWPAIVGGLIPIIAHAAVNRAKFGTLFSVPGGRQLLSLNDPARAAWFAGNNDSFFSARFLTTTLVQYTRPDAIRFERLIPGVRFGPVAVNRASYPLLGNTPASSLTLTATLLVILAVTGVFWVLRHRARTWMLVIGSTAVGALPTFMIGFLANRYLIDMLLPLAVAGAIGIWAISGDSPRRALKVVGVLLVLWGLWVNASLATWNLEQKSPGFTGLRYRIDEAVFPAPSPGVVRIDPTAPVPRDGTVGLDIDADNRCHGAYSAEQGKWVVIERSASTRRRITLGQLDIEVVADPITGEYFARAGDTVVLLASDAFEAGIGGGRDTSPLCRQLADRLTTR